MCFCFISICLMCPGLCVLHVVCLVDNDQIAPRGSFYRPSIPTWLTLFISARTQGENSLLTSYQGDVSCFLWRQIEKYPIDVRGISLVKNLVTYHPSAHGEQISLRSDFSIASLRVKIEYDKVYSEFTRGNDVQLRMSLACGGLLSQHHTRTQRHTPCHTSGRESERRGEA